MTLFLNGKAAGFNISLEEIKSFSWQEGWLYRQKVLKLIEEMRLSNLQRKPV